MIGEKSPKILRVSLLRRAHAGRQGNILPEVMCEGVIVRGNVAAK